MLAVPATAGPEEKEERDGREEEDDDDDDEKGEYAACQSRV